MRTEGVALRRIAGELGIGLSTASLWTRGFESPPDDVPAVPVVGVSTDRPSSSATSETRNCSRCRLDLPIDRFSLGPDGRQAWCKPCFREYRAGRRATNAARHEARRTRAARYALDHLRTTPCVDCGESDVVVLEFDHVRGDKRTEVARLVHHAAARLTLDAELAKCDVVCVNCHRRRTRARTAPRSTPPLPHEVRGRAVIVERLAGGCVDCGEPDHAVLDFDHRGPKRERLSQMPRGGYSVRAIIAELDVCEVRCGNCHRRRTSKELGFFRSIATGPPPDTFTNR